MDWGITLSGKKRRSWQILFIRGMKAHHPQWAFKAYIYGLYKVIDPKKILIFQNTNHKKEVLASDRVEIFFRKNDKMDPYYGLEMDPLTRIYDYRARYQRKFRQEWSWPEGEVTVKATINDTGYILEFAISKKSLRTFDLIKNNKIEAGLYRGECVQLEMD